LYANPVPATQTLPASLYLSTKPSWWGTMPWPAIGPDITGGDLPGSGGHAYRIPARVCFEDVMHGAFANTVASTFNANNCYALASSGGGGGADTTAPSVPTGLTATSISSSQINLSWTASTDPDNISAQIS